MFVNSNPNVTANLLNAHNSQGPSNIFGAPAPMFGNFGNNMATTSADFRSSMLAVSRNADLLASSINFMRGIGSQNASSPFRATLQAVSSDDDILQMQDGASPRLSNASNRPMSVEVLQLAEAQRNEGNALNASALARNSGFDVGNHQISITVGDRQFDFNFSVSATDTNRDVQQRIANAVNTRNIGVTASVNVEGGNSTLAFESTETGVTRAGQPNFTVSSGAGNALSVVGGNSITQDAQNAEFRVNRGFTGALQTSRSNDVSLGVGMNATLRELGTADVNMERNEVGQINAFRHLVNSFNNLVDAARGAGRGSRLEQELSNLARSSSVSLRRIGINVNNEGRMQIDEDRMAQAAETGHLESFVQQDRIGSNSGFLNRLTRVAGEAGRNPDVFAAPANSNDWFMSNPRMVNQMNRIVGMGMLFDSMM